MPIIIKSIQTESRLTVTRGWDEQENDEFVGMGFGGVVKCSKTREWWSLHNPEDTLKNIEFRTLHGELMARESDFNKDFI